MAAAVSFVQCRTYDREAVEAAVTRAVDLLGGIGMFVRPGDRVLVKPNLLKARSPDSAVTTHPEVVRAMIRLVHRAGGRAVVGDSPGIGDLRSVADKTGILAVAEEEGAELVPLDAAVPASGAGRFRRFEIAREARDADGIINLPKLKTHGMTVLTGAIKNLFGCIPGRRKVQWHFNTGVNRELFMEMLVELAALLKPRLTVMDSVVGMEGNGPASGDPRPLGAIIAGADPVSVDAVAARIVSAAVEHLPLLRAAARLGIGETRFDRIHLAGDAVDAIKARDFRLPPREHPEWPLPEWARKLMKDALTTRPEIDAAGCVRCGICADHCPQKALTERQGRLTVDYRRCIRCFCCQEFCPQGAIDLRKGWMLRLLRA